MVAKAPGPSHTPVAGSRPAVPPCGFCLSNVSPCWCKPVVMGTDISSARQSGSTTLQHPKGDPEAQRQSARMFQNSLFPLLPGGSVGCPLAVLVWGETQAPVVRSLAAWWKGWRRSVTPHSPQLVTYNHSVDLSSCGSLALAAGVEDADGCAVCGGPPTPCPVPVAVLLDDGKRLMRRGTFSCVGSCSLSLSPSIRVY